MSFAKIEITLNENGQSIEIIRLLRHIKSCDCVDEIDYVVD